MAAPKADPAPVVLVVDDEPILLRLMERALAEAGYRVEGASNGLRALELVGDSPYPPDVLVTDLRMDGLNGVDLAKLVTQNHPHTQVLLVSGYDPDHTEPAWPFLRKPFPPQALVAAVEQLLPARSRRASAG
jgi:DNA-binding NtrC family response regulator